MEQNLKNYPIEERNNQLLMLFTNLGFDVKLIGDKNQPKIVFADEFVISGFVKNRLYNFTTKPFGGDVIRIVNLNKPNITKNEILDILKNNTQRRFFRLRTTEELFYIKTENKIPLFSFTDSRYFFYKERALNTQKYLFNDFGIDTELLTSELKNLE